MNNIIVPQSLQLVNVEDRVLATLIHNPSYIHEFNLKDESYFYDSANERIYNAIFQVKDANPNLDIIKSRLDRNFHAKLDSLASQHAVNKADFKADFYLLRENDFLVKVYTSNEALNLSIPSLTKDAALEQIQSWKERLDLLSKYSVLQAEASLSSASDIATAVLSDLEAQAYSKGKLLGVSTGIKMLDDYILGLQRQHLIIAAGRPGAGKTALIVTIIRNYILRGEKRPLYFFSLEMTKKQIMLRLMASIARVKLQKLQTCLLSKDEWLRIIYAKSLIDASNVFIDDTVDIPVDFIENKVAEAKDIGLVCIDYLQLMQAKAASRALEIGKISVGCKNMAKRYNVPVLGLAQINRAVESDRSNKSNKRPDISHLRECVTGDTLVSMADGCLKQIKDVKKGDEICSINENNLTMEKSVVNDVWSTGEKEVFKICTQTGHEIKATANHPFLTVDGWKSVGNLSIGDMLGSLNIKNSTLEIGDKKTLDLCRFLGYMCGNGTMQKHRSIGCIVSDEHVKDDITEIVSTYFPKLKITTKPNRCNIPVWDMYFTRVFIDEPHKQKGNELINWLDSIGMIGVKDSTKFIPDFVLNSGEYGYREFISGYLATDGSVSDSTKRCIRYASVSKHMLTQLKHMLSMIEIVSILDKGYKGKQATMPLFNLRIPLFNENVRAFANQIKVIGKKGELLTNYKNYEKNTNTAHLGVLPKNISKYASKYPEYRFNNRHIKIETARDLAYLHDDFLLKNLVDGDVFFDKIVSIEKQVQKEETFDISVNETHNFVGNGLIIHNSGALEQDADTVLLLYRDKYYKPDTQYGDTAEIIIGKQRSGPVGTVYSLFLGEYVSFEGIEVS
jgi:replicative DNA helicase